MRILTVAGTRPELIKLAALVPLLDERFEHSYLFTGQHYSESMVDQLLGGLPVRAPDQALQVRSSSPDALRCAVDGAVARFKPDLVVVYGDTNSTLAAARSAHSTGAVLIHLEGGVRSFDPTMVEERNRIEVDRLADLRLAPTALTRWFLSHLEGYHADSCPAVGNLGVDSWMMYAAPHSAKGSSHRGALGGDFALLTLHRPDTVDRDDILCDLLRRIGELSMPVLFPAHPRTRKQLRQLLLPSNIRLLEPLSYLDFCALLSDASVVLTDSGGVQEEAATIGTPCVTLRPNTDRPESVLLGMNRLYPPSCGADLREVVEDAMGDSCSAHPVNPYGDGLAAARTTILLELLANREPSLEAPARQGLAGLQELIRAADFACRRDRRKLRVVGY